MNPLSRWYALHAPACADKAPRPEEGQRPGQADARAVRLMYVYGMQASRSAGTRVGCGGEGNYVSRITTRLATSQGPQGGQVIWLLLLASAPSTISYTFAVVMRDKLSTH